MKNGCILKPHQKEQFRLQIPTAPLIPKVEREAREIKERRMQMVHNRQKGRILCIMSVLEEEELRIRVESMQQIINDKNKSKVMYS